MRSSLTIAVSVGLLSVAAVALGAYLIQLTGVVLYDSNLDTFKSTMTEGQGVAITRTAERWVGNMFWLLVLTNGAWLFASVFLLLRIRKLTTRV